MTKAPGKSHREGISLIELTEMFPDEKSAVQWFEDMIWPEGRHCPRCGNVETTVQGNRYWCGACRQRFTVKTGTVMAESPLPLRKWAIAIYLEAVSLKGVSSMRLHRDLKITQKTAWFMLHRIREAWKVETGVLFEGPVEADETYVGGRRKNMPKSKRKGLTGRGASGKTAVAGVKDRATGKVSAKVVDDTTAETLQGFVTTRTQEGAQVYTDDATAYKGIDRPHQAVRHSAGEYVRDMAHTNGVESFWSMLKRAHKGTFHKISPKHLDRYVQEFAGRHNVRESDTVDMMGAVAAGMVGKRLLYSQLTADNGRASGARSA